MIKYFYKNQEGSTLIVTTMIVVAISTLLLISLGISSRNQFSIVSNLSDSEYLFYIVEGAVQETLQHATNDVNWPNESTYTDVYVMDEVNISRTIITTPDSRTYEVLGELDGNYRKILVTDDKVNDSLVFEEVAP